MPIHFVGRLEELDRDWARLRFAMTPDAVKLPPRERLKLIPPPSWSPPPSSSSSSSSAATRLRDRLREGPEHSGTHQPRGHAPSQSKPRRRKRHGGVGDEEDNGEREHDDRHDEERRRRKLVPSVGVRSVRPKAKKRIRRPKAKKPIRAAAGAAAEAAAEAAAARDDVPFTIEQELEVCRRYLQDLICFDYGIPRSCIQHAAAVY